MENNKKLKRSTDFNKISQFGRGIRVDKWLILAYRKTEQEQYRVGITISRKIGKAVLRNKLKRWVRSYFRSKKSTEFLNHKDFNFIFKPDLETYKTLDYKSFSQKVDTAIEKLNNNAKPKKT